MQIYRITRYSVNLKRDMHVNVYGHYGKSIIIFPMELDNAYDVEKEGIISALSEYIDEGKIKVYSVDDNNEKSFFSSSEDYEERTKKIELYYHYIIDEVLPLVYQYNEGYCTPYLVGASMGSVLASMCFFRNPLQFGGLLSISGLFDTTYFFNGWCNKTLYDNSPMLYLRDMSTNDEMIDIYNKKRIIISYYRNNWECDIKKEFDEFRKILIDKQISAWFDYWNQENEDNKKVWIKQMKYFIPYLID